MRALRQLAVMRIGFGLLFLLRTTELTRAFDFGWPHADGPMLGWPTGAFVLRPSFLALPDRALVALCVIRTLAASAFLCGFRARIFGLVAGALGYLTLSQDLLSFAGSLHLLFLGTLIIASTDCDAVWAVRPSPARAPISGLLLVRALVISIYAWAAIAKLRSSWLGGETLRRLVDDGMLRGDWIRNHAGTLSVVVLISEIALAVFLWLSRTRNLALVAAFAMHLSFQLVATPDSMGLEMMVLLLAFLPYSQREKETDEGEATSPSVHISSTERPPGST